MRAYAAESNKFNEHRLLTNQRPCRLRLRHMQKRGKLWCPLFHK